MEQTIRYSTHSLVRQAQRNLSVQDVEFVVRHGRRIRCTGALHIFLGRRDIPNDPVIQRQFARLEGTILVISDPDDPVLITAYRNRRGLKDIRVRAKYYSRPND